MDVMLLVFVVWTLLAFVGGFVAAAKGDFFTRGFFMTLIVGPLCLLFLLIAPKSQAKDHGGKDFSDLQQHGGAALIFQMIIYAFIIVGYKMLA